MAVHLGDIIDDGKDIYGEGINIASRLEGIAEPGGICISGDVYNQVQNRIPAGYEDLGSQQISCYQWRQCSNCCQSRFGENWSGQDLIQGVRRRR